MLLIELVNVKKSYQSAGRQIEALKGVSLKVDRSDIGTQLIYFVPRDNVVQRAEIRRKTVIEFNPESRQAQEYRDLAKAIDENTMFTIPKPMTQARLEEILLEHGLMDSVEDYAI